MTRRILKATLGATLLCVASCTCLQVPVSDAIDPVATMTVIFEDLSLNEVTMTVDTATLTTPITVNVPAGKSFQIGYGGRDAGGVEKLQLEEHWTTGTSTSAPTHVQRTFSSCPKSGQGVWLTQPWTGIARTHIYSNTATDFHGNMATSPGITVIHG